MDLTREHWQYVDNLKDFFECITWYNILIHNIYYIVRSFLFL